MRESHVSERGSRAARASSVSDAGSALRVAASTQRPAATAVRTAVRAVVRAAVSACRRVAARLGRIASSAAGRAMGGARGRADVVPRDAGMATAEYAIATIAAVGFAGLLVVVLRSGEVQELLLGLVRRALTV